MSIFDRFPWKNEEQSLLKRREQAIGQLSAQLQDNLAEDLAAYPQESEALNAFIPRLKKAMDRYALRQEAIREEGALPPVDGAACFFLSQDRMNAYACLLPPMEGGKEVDADRFWDDLRYEGVSQGLMKGEVDRVLTGRRYLHIFPVARGTAPVDGVDGQVTDLFERREAFRLEVAEDALVDFSGDSPIQAVRQGEIICRIQPPTAGQDGLDVTGQTLPCRDGAAAPVPMGENTQISEDGQYLQAKIDGAVSAKDGLFRVTPLTVVSGDAQRDVVKVKGALYIAGSVAQGVLVEAEGDVIVAGCVQKGRVTSKEGSVRVQQEAKGAAIQAARQVQVQVLEDSTVQSGGSVFAEVVVNSQVTCGGAANVLGGRGLILGGHVRAAAQISCKKLGNLSGQRNQVTVGYDPALMEELATNQEALDKVRATLEKLRKSITALRAAGELLSLEKRAVLSQLMEQRSLYENQEEGLAAQQKKLRQTLHAATTGRIICQELYPLTVVRIGDREEEIKVADTNCRIHVYAGRITTK